MTLHRGETQEHVRITAKKLVQRENLPTYTFICIEPAERRKWDEGQEPTAIDSIEVGEVSQQRIEALEFELQHAKQHLQATIEELETSNEELQATNEELVSSNEELQSTNEELHSVNEELFTVNSEYQQKITELTELSNDMENLMSSTDIGTVFLDNELKIRRFTHAIRRTVNLRNQDIGRPIEEISYNFEWENLTDDFVSVRDSRGRIEREICTREGEWYLMRLLPYVTGEGAVDGVVMTFVDIAMVKEAQAALRDSEERFRQLAENIDEVFWVTNVDGSEMIYVSPAYENIWGRTVEELYARPEEWADAAHPEDREKFRAAWRQRARGEGFDVEYRIVQPDGTEAWIHDRGQPIRNAEGQVYRIAGIAEDITHRKQEEELYRLFVEAAPVATILVDSEGSIIFSNREMERLFRVSSGDLGAMTMHDLLPEDQRIRSEQELRDFFANPTRTMSPGREQVVIRPAGTALVIEVGMSRVQMSRGREYAIVVIHDVTARRESEESLKAANDQLARTVAELDEFTYVASHDLREPLRKLISFSKLLPSDLGEEIPDRAQKDLGFIVDASERMQQLIDDLLRFSRAGKGAMDSCQLSVEEIADQVLDMLSQRVEETMAKVDRDPLPTLEGDPVLLTQVYQNLLSNALKFTPPNQRPVIRLTAERQDGEWILGVKDQGIGIDSKYAEQVFGPFKRLHPRSQYEGNGIGLSICRKAVERLGGRIWVESQEGQGAHFRFALPSGGGVAYGEGLGDGKGGALTGGG